VKTTFVGKRISAILGVLPEKEVHFEDEVGNYAFPEKQTLRLKKVMGYEKHRLSKETSTVSDFAIFGIDYMLKNDWIKKDEIGAIVTVSLCPDYFVPHIGNLIHSAFNFDEGVISIDLQQGCCGFILGLQQAFMLLEHMKEKKVILVNGDVLSHKVSKRDRNDFPLIGDGTAITIVENCDDSTSIYYEMNNRGSQSDALKIPAGGFRTPSTAETAIMNDMGDGNFRSLDNMHMDGTAVYNFVQTEVPGLIESILNNSGNDVDSIDYFFFHQPNKFMLQKLAQKIGIPFEKIPMNLVENVGNTSGATIPLVMLLNLKEQLTKEVYSCCLAAFGSGLSWGGMNIMLGNLSNCDLIITEL